MEPEMVWVYPCDKHVIRHQDMADQTNWDLDKPMGSWAGDDRFTDGGLLAGNIETAWASALDMERDGLEAATLIHSFNIYARNMMLEGVDKEDRPSRGVTPVMVFEARTMAGTTFTFAMDSCGTTALAAFLGALLSHMTE